ncbi:MAG: hypothetical protein HY287_06670 [Planctomycetes bacterium]|nr:hypothetical protein [Planctomycetota bacterium]
MASMEDLELLKAAIALALADGEIQRTEMGVIKGLAVRTGVGHVSFEAILNAAEQNPAFANNDLNFTPEKAKRAVEVLAAEAASDGNVSPKDRAVIEHITGQLKISSDQIDITWKAGIR